MSIELLNKALKLEGLTPTKKLVLVILANYADEKMELKFVPHCTTWLNQKRYLDDADTTVTKVKKSLNSLAG